MNIHVSANKLTLGLSVSLIGSHLTADQLNPVSPRVVTGPPKSSFLCDAKSKPALIIKSRLVLTVAHDDDLSWYIHNVYPEGTDVHSKLQQVCQQSKCSDRVLCRKGFTCLKTSSLTLFLFLKENIEQKQICL